ncbi:MAG TPA: post-COAP-1 domain-containing protein [Candidatus Limnocylindrales bacterium]|nr:post-COAP-1 domain-containing protein [Candidatus Limnocylindrales bacterium]
MEKVKIWVYMAAILAILSAAVSKNIKEGAQYLSLLAIVGFAALLVGATPAFAANAPSLGTASSFAVLGGPAVTVTNSAVIGDVGSGLPGSAVTLTTSTVVGTVHQGDATAAAAYNNFLRAYDALAFVPCDQVIDGNLAGQVLTPGVYCVDAASTTTNGVLTLNGSSNGIWIFKIGTNGTGALTGTNFSVVMEGGGVPCNVYWWVAEAATMTTTTATTSGFQGTILAGAAITITGNAVTPTTTTFNGSALAKAAVTLTDVTVTGCKATGGGKVPPPCRDFVTGGGWIDNKATFGVSGGIKNSKFRGQLSFNDHDGTKVKSTNVTAYTYIDLVTRQIEGFAKVNGKGSFKYTVVVADNGEPGRNKDSFSLNLSNGYNASGILMGGNIQLHKECGKPHDNDDKEKHDDKDEREGHNNCDRD